ncbi:hypothetical protein F5Y05DRAFT_412251 [Hypoxylon sp. FL0543]|nr:hypothetical protein F5Y05DRAFT_412251 [Hypoxylon sp. FL0543]
MDPGEFKGLGEFQIREQYHGHMMALACINEEEKRERQKELRTARDSARPGRTSTRLQCWGAEVVDNSNSPTSVKRA